MINVAVAGCGYWGPNLIRNFNGLGDCRMKIACDPNSERLAHIKKLYPGIETETDYDAVVNNPDIDAVVIATPVRFHFEMAKKSLEAGKHTMIEKPMTASVAEARILRDIATKNKLTLMVGHTFIYSTPVRKIKELISNKDRFGDMLYVGCRRLNLGLFQKDINVVWDLAPHDLSIILYTLGDNLESVNCQGKAHINPDIEDVCNLSLNFKGPGFATVQSSWLDPNKVREITFVGSKQMLVYDDLEPMEKIKIYDKHVETPPHYDTFAEFQYAYHYGDMHAPYLQLAEPLKTECQHFLDCIASGEEPITGATAGLRVVQILEAANKSLKQQGAAVTIETD
jgi:predicted dehydrogenase